MITPQEKTAKYYKKIGSRIGYIVVMKRSQHFGYYDKSHNSEKLAQENYHKKFSKLLKIKDGMKILDAGCGQGVVACYIATHYNANITGVTIAPREVKNSTKIASSKNVSGKTNFILADYAETKLANNSFDRIYTTESLSHAPDVQKVTDELFRLLKPKGLLVCAEYEIDYQNFNDEEKRLAELIKNNAAIHGVYQFGKSDFINKLNQSGFKVLDVQDWTKHTKPSFDRIRKIGKPFTKIVRFLNLEKYFINIAAAPLYSQGVEDGVFAYKVYICQK